MKVSDMKVVYAYIRSFPDFERYYLNVLSGNNLGKFVILENSTSILIMNSEITSETNIQVLNDSEMASIVETANIVATDDIGPMVRAPGLKLK